jgi:hypothetical protein
MSEAVQAITEQMSAPPPADPAAAAPAAPKADDRVSSKMEVLIRREQAALQSERRAKEQLTQSQTMLEKIKEFESAKANPKKALELLGLNYDELTKSLLADGTIPPEVEIKKLKDEFGAYKQTQEEAERKRLEDLKKQALDQETQAVTNFKSEINTYINDNASRYELTIFDGHIDEVFDLIDKHFDRSGKVMKIAEAADKIEEFYEKREVERKKLAKIQSLWGAVPKGTLAQAVKQEKTPSQKPETLTNNMSATPSKLGSRPSEDRRVQEIVAQFMASKRR